LGVKAAAEKQDHTVIMAIKDRERSNTYSMSRVSACAFSCHFSLDSFRFHSVKFHLIPILGEGLENL